MSLWCRGPGSGEEVRKGSITSTALGPQIGEKARTIAKPRQSPGSFLCRWIRPPPPPPRTPPDKLLQRGIGVPLTVPSLACHVYTAPRVFLSPHATSSKSVGGPTMNLREPKHHRGCRNSRLRSVNVRAALHSPTPPQPQEPAALRTQSPTPPHPHTPTPSGPGLL